MNDLSREELVALAIQQAVRIEHLEERALLDPMTALLRRWRGVEELDRLWKLTQRKRSQPYAVLFLDIDHFKAFNDTYDHDTGDRVLQLVASVILDEMRSTDCGVRWGGEELLIICPNTTQAEALQLASRIRVRVSELDTGTATSVTASIGVSDDSRHDTESGEVVARADSALYSAKNAGRNCVAQLFRRSRVRTRKTACAVLGVGATLEADFHAKHLEAPKVPQMTTKRGRLTYAEHDTIREQYGRVPLAQLAQQLNRPAAGVRKQAEKLLAGEPKFGPWGREEVACLKGCIGVATMPELQTLLRRTEQDITLAANAIHEAVKNNHTPLSRTEVARFKAIYGTRDDRSLSIIFERHPDVFTALARELRLNKDKAFVRKREGSDSTKMPRWAERDIATLTAMYEGHSNLEIARMLGRSVKSVVSKAHNLKLKKSADRLRSMGQENVRVRYEDQ